MNMKSLWILLKGCLLAAGMLACFRVCAAQDITIALREIKVNGSEPPSFNEWHGCVDGLRGSSYTKESAQACLNSILKTRYFVGGKIETSPYGTDSVKLEFVLDAPSLILTKVDLYAPADDIERLRQWLAADRDALQTGDVYQRGRELGTWHRIDNFYKFEGRSAGISERLNLNYEDKTAQLSYTVFEGPHIPKVSLISPDDPPCKELIGVFNMTGLDDFVPTPLVDRLIKVHGFSCLDEKLLSVDRETLRKTNLFQDVKYSIAGSADYREVSVSIVGKPLRIGDVSVNGYGRASGLVPPNPDRLRLRSGEIYSRSDASEDMDYLKELYSKAGESVDIIEDEGILPGNELLLKYNVLVYDQNEIFVDGQRMFPSSGAVRH